MQTFFVRERYMCIICMYISKCFHVSNVMHLHVDNVNISASFVSASVWGVSIHVHVTIECDLSE